MLNTSQIGCSHNPKTVKKIGVVAGKLLEILVCNSCRHDPDLSEFKEEELQN